MGRKPKPEYDLPEEIKIVLECSPNLQPCAKFRCANIYRFAEHMKNDKCQQCIAWFQQTDKELKTMRLLAAWRKSRKQLKKTGPEIKLGATIRLRVHSGEIGSGLIQRMQSV